MQSAAPEGGHHDDIGAGADLIVHKFLHLVHLLAHVDELELIDRHALLMLDVLLQHTHSVLLLVRARQLAICNRSDLQSWHLYITNISSKNTIYTHPLRTIPILTIKGARSKT
jgi:hypothetical protein